MKRFIKVISIIFILCVNHSHAFPMIGAGAEPRWTAFLSQTGTKDDAVAQITLNVIPNDGDADVPLSLVMAERVLLNCLTNDCPIKTQWSVFQIETVIEGRCGITRYQAHEISLGDIQNSSGRRLELVDHRASLCNEDSHWEIILHEADQSDRVFNGKPALIPSLKQGLPVGCV